MRMNEIFDPVNGYGLSAVEAWLAANVFCDRLLVRRKRSGKAGSDARSMACLDALSPP